MASTRRDLADHAQVQGCIDALIHSCSYQDCIRRERSRGRLQEAPLFLFLLLAAQMPKFSFQFRYARFSGETSCLLFAGASLSNQTTVPLFFLTQKPAIRNRIPEP